MLRNKGGREQNKGKFLRSMKMQKIGTKKVGGT